MLATIPRGSLNTKNAPRRRKMGEEMIWWWSRYFLKVETKLGHPPKSSCGSLNPKFTDGSIVSPHNKSSSNPSTPILSSPPFSQSPKNLNRRTHFPRLPPRCKQNSRTHTRNISRDRPSTTQPNLGHLPLCRVRFFFGFITVHFTHQVFIRGRLNRAGEVAWRAGFLLFA